MPFKGVVLVDTNAVIECHAKGCWKALAGAYHLETVEAVVIETQTGNQRRRPEQVIDEPTLRKQLRAVHAVSEIELAEVMLRGGGGLDEGEKALWAHALTRQDDWVLCGPDRASMRFGFENQMRDRLVSLGGLLTDIKVKPALGLARNFERAWLEDVLSKLTLGIR